MKRFLFVIAAAALALTACKEEFVENSAVVSGVMMDRSASSIVLISTDDAHNNLDTLILSTADPAFPDSLESCSVNDYVTVRYLVDEPVYGKVLSLKVQSHLVTMFLSEVGIGCIAGNSDDEGPVKVLAPAPEDSTFFSAVRSGDEIFLSCEKGGIKCAADTVAYTAREIIKVY